MSDTEPLGDELPDDEIERLAPEPEDLGADVDERGDADLSGFDDGHPDRPDQTG